MQCDLVKGDAHVLFQHPSKVGNHAKHANGTRDGGFVGEDSVCCTADVVPTRSRQVAHAHHKRFARFFEQHRFPPNDITRKCTASRRVHPQHHRFNIVRFSRLFQGSGNGFRANGRSITFSAFDGADGIDDGHVAAQLVDVFVFLVVIPFFQSGGQQIHPSQEALGQGVFPQRNHGGLFALQLFLQQGNQLVFVEQAIHETCIDCILRSANRQTVGEVIEGAWCQIPGRLDVRAHVSPKSLQQGCQLLLVGLTEIFPQVGFNSALVFVVWAANNGDVDAKLFEHSWVEHALAPQPVQKHASLGMQVHFVGRRIEMQGPLAHGLRPRHNELVAVSKDLETRAKVFHHGRHHSDVSHVEQDPLDLIVASRTFEGVEDLVQPHLHVGLQASHSE